MDIIGDTLQRPALGTLVCVVHQELREVPTQLSLPIAEFIFAASVVTFGTSTMEYI